MFTPVEMRSFSLGKSAPRLGPVQVTYESSAKDHCSLTIYLGLNIQTDLTIDLWLGKRVHVGIRKFSLKADMVLEFCPILNELPITGGLRIHFLSDPEFDYDLTGVGNVTDPRGCWGQS